MNGAKYSIFEFSQFNPDPNTADLKYALKSFHTVCAPFPRRDDVDIIGLPVINCRNWVACVSESCVGHLRASYLFLNPHRVGSNIGGS